MGRVRLTLAILVSVIGVVGLLVCAITRDRWLGVLDLAIHDRGGAGDSSEHIYGLHDGIYFDIEFRDEWQPRNMVRASKARDLYLHQRGGVTPSQNPLPTHWGFSRASTADVVPMGNESGSITQWSFPLWPIFLIGLLPIPVMAIRAMP